MATVKGTDYSYVDIYAEGSQDATRHYIVDAEAREDLGEIDNVVSTLTEVTIPTIQNDMERVGNDLTMVDNRLYLTHSDPNTGASSRIGNGVDVEAGVGFDSGYVDDNGYMHLTSDGTDLDTEEFTPFFVGNGGGGSGSGGGIASITRIGESSIDCIYGDPVLIRFNFTATDSGGDAVGDGTGTWSIGGVTVVSNVVVHQGANSFDISPYLTAGLNNLKLTVKVDTGGETLSSASKTWTVNAVNMYFTWAYDDAQINTGEFTDRWTPYGEILKVTHTSIDGTEIATSSTTRSGSPQSIQIPMRSHGAHPVERWITASIGGTPQSTARQYHEMIFVEEGNMTPIVAISMQDREMDQYDTLQIPVVVYDPSALLADAELAVNGATIGTWTDLDRTLHYWSYTPTASGTQTLTVTCGSTTASIVLTVNAVAIDTEEVSGYSFRFKASEMATNNAVRSWASNGVTATFSSNFDWINGGLHTERVDDNLNETDDPSGYLQQYLCIKAGTTMTINHKLFASDPKSAGMNYKIIFKVKNVRNYDAQIGHCYADGVGIRMYAHQSVFNSSGTSINVPYGEDEYIELEFEVYPAPRLENDGNFRYIMAWIDGVITTCRVYGPNDNFVQSTLNQENIVLGSDDCDIYLYMVKAYPTVITRDNHVNNFVMDAPNAPEMVRRYDRNNILDGSGNISYEKLLEKNPDCRVFLYDIPYMTNDKKDEVGGCTFHQFWPHGDKYFELSGTCTMTVQGTSSVKYIKGAANTDSNFGKNKSGVVGSLRDGYGNDLLAGGTPDKTYGNNWFVDDADNPGHAKQYTVSEARAAAGLTSASAELGPEWVVVERDSNRNPTKYIKALGLKISDTSCPITYSNVKVNFASCEQVNNMCNAAWYQRFNPYPSLTARDCMEFVMGVQFIRDNGTVPDSGHFVLWGDDKYHMYSIANMGNSKKNVHVFHDLSNPNEVCVEVNDNNADQMRMINDDLSAEDWSGDVYYGMRYPDTKNPSQAVRNAWQRLVSWFAHNDLSPYDPEHHIYGYTGEQLATPETYENYTFRGHDRAGTQILRGTTITQYAGTYTHDTFERRMAKMLSECEDYMVMDSFVYHFLYLERHTMVDNVSKNNFWSSTDLLHWDLSKAYDMDTSDGNNNQGQMVFDYGNEYNDINSTDGKNVFNGSDSVWFVFCANLYEACRTMFTNREAAGAWSATAYHNFLLSEQHKVPERCWIECYWYDYLRTYEQGISEEWMTFLDGGQKTHQRKHYEFFEELYDSSKYRGSVSTVSNINFRAYKPSTWAGVEPKSQITITMYNKMYISLEAGTTVMAPIKAYRGIPYTIDFPVDVDVGGTQIAINTASMIQAVSGMEQLYPDTCVFSMATRLRELKIGSTAAGYANTFLRTLALSNNTMLERLEVQNLPNANSVLDLTNCPSLLYVDATGSGFTGYEFADGGLLNTAILNKPVSLSLQNLAYLTDEHFTINDYSALSIIRHENTPGVDSLALVNAATGLQIARLIGIDWTLPDGTALARMYSLQGLDEGGYTISRSVLTGDAYVPTMRQRDLDMYEDAWRNLNITYDSMVTQFAVYFYNADGTPIKDLYGNDYVQYVDQGYAAHDPVASNEVATPLLESDEQYDYSWSGWDNLSGAVIEDRNVTATYTKTTRTYTVRWFARAGDLRKTITDVAYGSEVAYNSEDPYDFPTLANEEEAYIYKVFKGWNRSTGYITGNTDVYAIWDTGTLPTSGTALNDMTISQIYAVAKNNMASDYWTEGLNNTRKDYIDIKVGKDFNFNSGSSEDNGYVRSEVLMEEEFFDGTRAVKTDIKLFDADAPTFTLAIDYEFIASDEANSTLVGCYAESSDLGSDQGFRLRYTGTGGGAYPNIQWGNMSQNVGYGFERGIVVIRHRKGSDNLYIVSDNPGSGMYNANILVSEKVRSKSTLTDAVLTFGGVPFGDTSYDFMAKGWVHWCKIWYGDLGKTAIQQLANWPHETWRMEYCGAERYRLAGDTATKCSASFICKSTLWLNYGIGSATNGWNGSPLRTFTNKRCFGALPFEWEYIVKSVKIRAAVPDTTNNSFNIITSEDKVYIPAYIEVGSTTSEPYISEGDRITWYTNNVSRRKWHMLYPPVGAQTFTNQTDPTRLEEATVNEGDMWVRTGTSGYFIYVSQETYEKHGYWPGYTTRVVAGGDQGGAWISTDYWLLRSPYSSSTSNMWRYIYESGDYSGSSNPARGIVPCFSI